MKEMVNHPEHYKGNRFEVIDIIEDYQLSFHLGNAIKYILRAGKKDSAEQDLNKAIWYIKRHIENLPLPETKHKPIEFEWEAKKFYKHDKNTDVCFKMIASFNKEGQQHYIVDWYNIVNPHFPPRFITQEVITIKDEDILSWKEYEHVVIQSDTSIR